MTCNSEIPVKGVVLPLITEHAVPMAVEKINLEMREMPGVTDITEEIEGTKPELYKIEKNVPRKEKYNIFELKDVWRKCEISCNSPLKLQSGGN